jgi:hypothetical protein
MASQVSSSIMSAGIRLLVTGTTIRSDRLALIWSDPIA